MDGYPAWQLFPFNQYGYKGVLRSIVASPTNALFDFPPLFPGFVPLVLPVSLMRSSTNVLSADKQKAALFEKIMENTYDISVSPACPFPTLFAKQ
jgi:hypothetical protein